MKAKSKKSMKARCIHLGGDWVTDTGSTNLWFAHPTLDKTVTYGCIIADIDVLALERNWVNKPHNKPSLTIECTCMWAILEVNCWEVK